MARSLSLYYSVIVCLSLSLSLSLSPSVAIADERLDAQEAELAFTQATSSCRGHAVVALDGRNRTIVVAESLARVIAQIRITSVR